MLQKMAKQREESLAIFTKAGRDDLATVESEEIAILGEFLPKMMSDAEVEAAIAAAIAKTGAAGGKDMGKVIAALKAEYPGRIDFGKASAQGEGRAGLASEPEPRAPGFRCGGYHGLCDHRSAIESWAYTQRGRAAGGGLLANGLAERIGASRAGRVEPPPFS